MSTRTYIHVWTLTLSALLILAEVTFASMHGAVDVSSNGANTARSTIIVDKKGDGDYYDIQDAVDDAEDGDVIIVKAGTYEEEIEISDKSIELRGANIERTIIKGPERRSRTGITIESDNCTVSGFSVFNWSTAIEIKRSADCLIENCNTTSDGNRGIDIEDSCRITIDGNDCSLVKGVDIQGDDGISLEKCNDCLIANNTVRNNDEDGISLKETYNTRVINNHCRKNRWGIVVFRSDSNLISCNYCIDNWRGGIDIFRSTCLTIEGNNLNNDAIWLSGLNLNEWCSHTIEKTNLVGGKPVLYKVQENGGTVDETAGQIILADSHNMLIDNHEFKKGKIGIISGFSSNNSIENCSFFSNGTAIHCICSNDTRIRNCLFSNVGTGIEMDSSNRFITENNRFESFGFGIDSFGTGSSVVRNNHFENYKHCGIFFRYAFDCILEKNAFNTSFGTYSASFQLFSSSRNRISNNTIKNNMGRGLDIEFAHDNLIEFNSISRNEGDGINIQYMCSGNAIRFNEISDNNHFGLNITCSSRDNLIHHNNFIDNNNGNIQVYDGSGNYWNDTYGKGNYWSDYISRFPDAANDGSVWETPYVINASRERMDHYPLKDPLTIDILHPGEMDLSPFAEIGDIAFVRENERVVLWANGSHDDLGIENYTWTLDYNGSILTIYGRPLSFVFDDPGIYNVTLTVRDENNGTGTDSRHVIVRDATPPRANAGKDIFVHAFQNVIFDASNSSDNTAIVNYTWTFRYGSDVRKQYGPEAGFIFGSPGIYDVILSVRDAENNTANDTLRITVTAQGERGGSIRGFGKVEPLILGVVSLLVLIGVFILITKIRGRHENDEDDDEENDEDDGEGMAAKGSRGGKTSRGKTKDGRKDHSASGPDVCCTFCGRPVIPPDSPFCPYCGKKQQFPPLQEHGFPKQGRDASPRCSKCGTVLIPADAVFCQICGTKQIPVGGSTASTRTNRCIDCGASVEPPFVFCPGCTSKRGHGGRARYIASDDPRYGGIRNDTGRQGNIPPPPLSPGYGPLQ